MELRDYGHFARRNWLIVIAVTIIGALAGWGITLAQVPRYSATASVFVSTTSSGTVSELSSAAAFSQQAVRNLSEVVSTSLVLDPVIRELGLDVSSMELAEQVTGRIRINTAFLDVVVVDTDADTAAAIANAVTAELVETAPQLIPSAGAPGTAAVEVTVAQPARASDQPDSPNLRANVIIGALIGLVIGICVALVRFRADTRIRDARDVSQVARHLPILGAIPTSTGRRRGTDLPDEVLAHSEPLQLLRTNIQLLKFAQGAGTFVVTSARAREGKSFVAANLARALAASGRRVVIVDGDLRHPAVAENLGADDGPGLADVLAGRITIDKALKHRDGSELVVLPAGAVDVDPATLFASESMRALMEYLESRFDIVIVDTAPLLPALEGAMLSVITSGAIVVVGSGQSTRADLAAALDVLSRAGARVHGVVLNRVAHAESRAYSVVDS